MNFPFHFKLRMKSPVVLAFAVVAVCVMEYYVAGKKFCYVFDHLCFFLNSK